MSKKFKLSVATCGWPRGTIVTKCEKDPSPRPGMTLVECHTPGIYKHGSNGHNTQPDGMWGAWVSAYDLEEIKPEEKLTGVQTTQVLPASSVPPVTVKREVLTIDKIGVGQTFIVHGKPDEVYVKISNSHVFNHKRLQMHTTDAQRFTQHLNLVVVELVVYNGK
ncbi:gp3.2 [Escherichia phage EcoDS1]|uniref:Gp3.2 n=1 Tax=Escherichia phage EcoDS1 TaxID=532075 RepID=B3VCU4_9CAUD|nr:gp3.2 [Escherichia phage EcoDS1]ACF15799.1 gp3.2 [Escherichia phage EcoDS1]